MTVWLAIDTATDTAGVALHDGSAVLAESTWTSRRRHTVELAPTVARLLERNDLEVARLAGIAVAIGPGSYTGLRIGLSLAKGLALGADVPLVGVPTLDVVAAPLSAPHMDRGVVLWAVLRAGRGRLVAGKYPPEPDGWPAPGALSVTTVDELAKQVSPGQWAAGELDERARQTLTQAGARVLPPAACARRPSWLAELGRARLGIAGTAGADDAAELVPVYTGSVS